MKAIQINTAPSADHETAMSRYRLELANFAYLVPPLTVDEKKHILDACLTGGSIFLRNTFSLDMESK